MTYFCFKSLTKIFFITFLSNKSFIRFFIILLLIFSLSKNTNSQFSPVSFKEYDKWWLDDTIDDFNTYILFSMVRLGTNTSNKSFIDTRSGLFWKDKFEDAHKGNNGNGGFSVLIPDKSIINNLTSCSEFKNYGIEYNKANNEARIGTDMYKSNTDIIIEASFLIAINKNCDIIPQICNNRDVFKNCVNLENSAISVLKSDGYYVYKIYFQRISNKNKVDYSNNKSMAGANTYDFQAGGGDKLFRIRFDEASSSQSAFNVVGSMIKLHGTLNNSVIDINVYDTTYINCLPGYYSKANKCDPINNMTCKYALNVNSCSACFSSSKYYYSDNIDNASGIPGNHCTLEYFDFSKVSAEPSDSLFINDVPVATHWNFSIDFWIWTYKMSNLSNTVYKIIYADFMTIVISSKNNSSEDVDLHCIPFEYNYNIRDMSNKTLINAKLLQWNNGSKNVFSSNSSSGLIKYEWVNIKCAFSYDYMTSYALINDIGSENTLDIPYWDTSINPRLPNNSFHTLNKKFYSNNKTQLILQHFNGASQETYLRNLNVFNIYIPINITKNVKFSYYNLYISLNSKIPNLLFTIPFDNINGNNNFNSKVYDFYNNNEFNFKISSSAGPNARYIPSVFFKRIPFIAELNKTYTDSDLNLTTLINTATYELTFMENTKGLTCTNQKFLYNDYNCYNSCPSSSFRSIFSKGGNYGSICNMICDSNVSSCPSSISPNSSLSNNFSCKANYINNYYRCLDKSNDNNYINTAFQFSNFFNTPGVKIDLGEDIGNFTVDFWFKIDFYALKSYNSEATIKTYLSNKLIFLTDSFSINYDSNADFIVVKVNGNIVTSLNKAIYSQYEWFHIVFNKNSNKESYFSINNNLNDTLVAGYTPTVINTPITLRYIYFCNNGYDTICNDNWGDYYYKDLKIWKNTSYINAYYDIDTSKTSESILIYFKMDIENLVNAVIKCTNCSGSIVSITNDFMNTVDNIDKGHIFNIGNNISHTNLYSSGKYVTYMGNNANEDTISLTVMDCNIRCTKCFGANINECLECVPGYILENTTCVDINSYPYNFGYFVYQHPPIGDDLDVTFDASNFFAGNPNSVTVFFFVKFLSINYNSVGNICLIQLDNNFCFYSVYKSSTTFDFELIHNGNTLFSIPYSTLTNFIGYWTPISISVYKEKAPYNDFISMISMTYNMDLLEYMPGISTYYNIDIKEVTLKKQSFIGLYSHLILYDSFIINPYGIIKKFSFNLSDINSSNHFEYDPSINSKHFILRNDDPNNTCADASDITDASIIPNITCKFDYNPYLDYNSAGSTNATRPLHYITSKTIPSEVASANGCCVDTINPCMRDFCSSDPSSLTENNYVYEACDYKSKFYEERQIEYSTTLNLIRCNYFMGINFNKFNMFTLNNINSSSNNYMLTFWFYSFLYIDDNAYSPISNKNTINLTIKWSNHLEINIYRDNKDNVFLVRCKGLQGNFYYNAYNNLNKTWIFLGCGIDVPNNRISLFSNDEEVAREDFSIKLSDYSASGILTIDETSSVNYGFTIAKNITLWKCYKCVLPSIIKSLGNNSNYSAHLANIDYLFHTLDTQDSKLLDSINNQTYNFPTVKTDYIGNHAFVPDETALPTLKCSNDINQELVVNYFDSNTLDCNVVYNSNLIGDIEFNNVPNNLIYGRYSISVWMMVHDLSNFNGSGINYIYENHISLHVMRDTSNNSILSTICFPQEFKYSIKNLDSSSILTAISSNIVLNHDIFNITYTSNNPKWTLHFCTVNAHEGLYYVGDNPAKKLNPNFILNNATPNLDNFTYYRHFIFDDSKFTNVNNKAFIQKTNTSGDSRIYIRNFNLFNDYIPKELYDRLLLTKNFVSFFDFNIIQTTFNNLILLSADYNLNTGIDLSISTISGTLEYYLNNKNTKQTSNLNYSASLNKVYSLSSNNVFNIFHCNYNEENDALGLNIALDSINNFNYYSFIKGCVNICPDSNYILNVYDMSCSNAPDYYFCDTSNHLNINNFQCAISSAPPSNYNYSPNYNSTKGMFYFKYSNYELSYTTSYSCVDTVNKKKFYHNCLYKNNNSYNSLTNSKSKHSGIYFSHEYSFQDIIIDLNSYGSISNNNRKYYILEFWFYADNQNLDSNNSSNDYYFFIAPPHLIYGSQSDNSGVMKTNLKYLHENENVIHSMSANDINIKEWNIVYIEVSENSNTNIFLNYDLSNPVASFNNSSNIAVDNLKGFVFCNLSKSCTLGSKSYNNLYWGNTWYKNIKLWNKFSNSLSVHTIQTFSSYNNEQSILNLFNPNKDLTNILLLNIDFYIDSFTEDTTTLEFQINDNRIGSTITYNLPQLLLNTGNERRVNFTPDFDYVYSYDQYDQYITDKSTTPITNANLNSCAANCRRCYFNNSTSCYQCNLGYKLYNNECIRGHGYFLSTAFSSNEIIELSTNEDLSTHPKLTIAFYFKLLSLSNNANNSNLSTQSATFPNIHHNQIIGFSKSTSPNSNFLAYAIDSSNTDSSNNNYLVLILNNKEAFKIDSSNIGNGSTSNHILNTWNFISLSIYRSSDNSVSPNILGLQINRNVITPNTAVFDYKLENVVVDGLFIHPNTVSLFADLKVYSSYINGPYGIIKGELVDTKDLYIIEMFQLVKPILDINSKTMFSDSNKSNCVDLVELNNPTVLTNIKCIIDFHEYFDLNENCSTKVTSTGNNHILNITGTDLGNYSCIQCNNFCNNLIITSDSKYQRSCYDKNDTNCSCFVHRFSFMLQDDNKCVEIENINLTYLTSNFNLPVESAYNKLLNANANTHEFTIELWIYIYSYISYTFSEYNIIYDGHLRIQIIKDSSTNSNIIINCFPYAKEGDFSNYTTEVSSESILEQNWYYIRCAVNRHENYNKYYISSDIYNSITKSTPTEKDLDNTIFDYETYLSGKTTVNLSFSDSNLNPNYGFLYIRELKVYMAYLYNFQDTRNKIFNNFSDVSYLIAYYNFSNDNMFDTSTEYYIPNSPNSSTLKILAIKEEVTNTSYNVNLKTYAELEGYNIVNHLKLNYDKTNTLKFCNNSEYYDQANNDCLNDNLANQCKVSYDGSSNCITCKTNKINLHSDGLCYSTCPDGFYNETFIEMCRLCNINCETCNGPRDDQCLTCKNNKYLLKTDPNLSEGKCVDFCDVHGRVANDYLTPKECQLCLEQCNNFNEYDRFELTDIPSSFPIGRYSLGFWLFIEDTSLFTSGFNIIYEKHVGIHINLNPTSNTDYDVICIPQEYRLNISGVVDTANLTNLLKSDSYNNYIEHTNTNSSGTWIYNFCSVNIPEGIYYLNDGNESKLKPYFTLNPGNTSNTFYYRDIDRNLPSFTDTFSLVIENTNASNSRLYLKQIVLFRDYITKSIYSNNLFYKDITNYITNNKFTSLILVLDIPIIIDPNSVTNNFSYNKILNDMSISTNLSISSPLKTDKNYTNDSIIIDLNLCSEIQEIDSSTISQPATNYNNQYRYLASSVCKDIKNTTLDTTYTCNNTTDFCLASDFIYFWCNNNNFLNTLTMKCDSNTSLNNNLTRQPNALYNKGYSSFSCINHDFTINNSLTCPKNVSTSSNYNITKFGCINNFSQFFYECIPNDKFDNNIKINKANTYFSSNFNFQDINIDISSNNYNEYTLEFWMLIDNSIYANNKANTRLANDENYYYFIAEPHRIYANIPNYPLDNNLIFRYSNTIASRDDSFTNNSSNINIYEWIIIYISVYIDNVNSNTVSKLYINNNFENTEIEYSVDSNLDMNLKSFKFCSDLSDGTKTNSCGLSLGSKNKWGFGWYKNIKIYEHSYGVSPRFFQLHSQLYGNNFKSLLNYLDFHLSSYTLDSSTNLYEIYDLKNASIKYHTFITSSPNDDYDRIINYSIDYDIIEADYDNNKSNHIINESHALNPCFDTNCLRCFGPNVNQCYMCETNYLLINNNCKQGTGFYFRTPNSNDDVIPLRTSDINIDNINKLTICFYTKIISLAPSAVQTSDEHPMIFLSSDLLSNSLNYKTTSLENKLKLYFNSKIAYDVNLQNFTINNFNNNNLINNWFLISISIHRSKDSTVYPNMLNFEIHNNNQITVENSFNIESENIIIDTIAFNHQVIAYYNNLKIFRNYIIGSLGILKSSNLNNLYLVKEFSLHSSIFGNSCLNIASESNDLTLQQSSISCILEEYKEMIDHTLMCTNTNKEFFDYNNNPYNDKSYTCKECDNRCLISSGENDITNKITKSTCNNDINSTSNSNYALDCSCINHKYSFMIYKDSSKNTNYCKEVKHLNFNYVRYDSNNSVSIPVRASKNNEYTLEFWILIYSYIVNNFNSLEIGWDGHLKIAFNNEDNSNIVSSKCYPYIELNTNSGSPDYDNKIKDIFIQSNIEINKWTYVRCSVNRISEREEYYYNDNDGSSIKAIPNYNNDFLHEQYISANTYTSNNNNYLTNYKTVKFNIKNTYTNPNHGFLFIREIKLYSAFLFNFYSTKYKILTHENFENELNYVLHYFPNINKNMYDYTDDSNLPTTTELEDRILSDTDISKLNNFSLDLIDKDLMYGYNIAEIIDNIFDQIYESNLYLKDMCKENEYLEQSSNICITSDNTNNQCKITSSTSNSKCLLCKDEVKYLTKEDNCVDICPIGYYGDDYILMCRKCYKLCSSCISELYNECTNCIDEYYLLKHNFEENLGECVEDCSVHGYIGLEFKQDDGIIIRECAVVSIMASANITNIDLDIRNNPDKINYLNIDVNYVQMGIEVHNGVEYKYLFNKDDETLNSDINKNSDFIIEWKYDINKNKDINIKKNYINMINIPKDYFETYTDPFKSGKNSTNVTFIDDFIQQGLDYEFELHITAYLDDKKLLNKTAVIKYIVKTTVSPYEGQLNVIPMYGLDEITNFVIRCDNYIEDTGYYINSNKSNSAQDNITYKLSYKYIGGDTINQEEHASLLEKHKNDIFEIYNSRQIENENTDINSNISNNITNNAEGVSTNSEVTNVDKKETDTFNINTIYVPKSIDKKKLKYYEDNIILSNYSQKREVISKFKLSNNNNLNSYYSIVCEIKDSFNLINIEDRVIKILKKDSYNLELVLDSMFSYSASRPINYNDQFDFTPWNNETKDLNTTFTTDEKQDYNNTIDSLSISIDTNNNLKDNIKYNNYNFDKYENSNYEIYAAKSIHSNFEIFNYKSYYSTTFMALSLANNLFNTVVNEEDFDANVYNGTVKQTKIIPNNILLNIYDASCNNSYCSGNGNCKLVNNYATCICNENYFGVNCHITSKTYYLMKKLYFDLIYMGIYINDSVEKDFEFNNELLEIRIKSIFNLVSGASFFLKADFFDINVQHHNFTSTLSNITNNQTNNENDNLSDYNEINIKFFQIVDKFISYCQFKFPKVLSKLFDYLIAYYDTMLNFGLSNILPQKSIDNIYRLRRNLQEVDQNESTLASDTSSKIFTNATDELNNNNYNNVNKEKLNSYNYTSKLDTNRFSDLFESNTKNYKVFFNYIRNKLKNLLNDVAYNNLNNIVQYSSHIDLTKINYEYADLIIANEKEINTVTEIDISSIKYDNLLIQISPLNMYNQLIKRFKDYNEANYYPTIDINNCIKNTFSVNSIDELTNLSVILVNFRTSPFIYDSNIYENSVSSLLSVDIIDNKTKNKVDIKNCNNSNNKNDKSIKLYFPVENIIIPDFVNDWRSSLEPSSQLTIDDNYFREPRHILKTGYVLNKTLSERFNLKYVPINFTCNFIDNSNLSLSNSGMFYKNYTVDNYFECSSEHLTDFSISYFLNPLEIDLLSRFFYLSRTQLFIYNGNYNNNYALFVYILLIIIYLFKKIIEVLVLCLNSNKRIKKFDNLKKIRENNKANTSYLLQIKKYVVCYNLPYLTHYNYDCLNSNYNDLNSDNLYKTAANHKDFLTKNEVPKSVLNNLAKNTKSHKNTSSISKAILYDEKNYSNKSTNILSPIKLKSKVNRIKSNLDNISSLSKKTNDINAKTNEFIKPKNIRQKSSFNPKILPKFVGAVDTKVENGKSEKSVTFSPISNKNSIKKLNKKSIEDIDQFDLMSMNSLTSRKSDLYSEKKHNNYVNNSNFPSIKNSSVIKKSKKTIDVYSDDKKTNTERNLLSNNIKNTNDIIVFSEDIFRLDPQKNTQITNELENKLPLLDIRMNRITFKDENQRFTEISVLKYFTLNCFFKRNFIFNCIVGRSLLYGSNTMYFNFLGYMGVSGLLTSIYLTSNENCLNVSFIFNYIIY